MLVTKREVKQTSKKLLSVLLALVMMMTSMSVCFGTFTFAANIGSDFSGYKADAIEYLAEHLNGSTVKKVTDKYNIGNTTNDGEGQNTNNVTYVTDIKVDTYEEYCELRDILIYIDKAVKGTQCYQTGTADNKDEQTKSCVSAGDVEAEILDGMGGYVTPSAAAKEFLAYVLEDSKAVQHSSASETDKSPAKHIATLNVYTEDYKGYLEAHEGGNYSTVDTKIEMGFTYSMYMKGGLYYQSTGTCKKNYYHNAIWLSDYPINAPSSISGKANTSVKTTLATYASYVDNFVATNTFDAMAVKSTEAIEALKTEIANKTTEIKNYIADAGEGKQDQIYDKLFPGYAAKISTFNKNADDAKAIALYSGLANDIAAYQAANPNYGVFNWGGFDEATIKADYKSFTETYASLLNNATVYNFFVKQKVFSGDYINNFRDNTIAYDLEDLKVEKLMPLYDKYALSFPMEGGNELSLAEKQSAYSELSGYINNVRSYTTQVQNAIFPESLNQYLDLQEKLECQVAECVVYFAENVGKDYTDVATDDVIAEIGTAKAQLAALNNLKNSIDYADNTALLDGAFANANTFIAYLYSLLGERYTAQVEIVDTTYTAIGRPTSNLTIKQYSQLNAYVNGIEQEIVEFLDAEGKGSLVSTETRNKYAAIDRELMPAFNAFEIDRGFNNYSAEDVLIRREDNSKEIFRENSDKDNDGIGEYEVTDANVNAIVDLLEAALKDPTVAKLLGDLINKDEDGNPTGEAFSLSGLVTGLLDDVVFTDSLINTIMQFVYPLVLKEFAKVWAGLPPTITIPDVDTGFMGIKADVEAGLKLDDVETAIQSVGLYIAPTTLAANLNNVYGNKYKAVADVLSTITQKAKYDKVTDTFRNPWENVNLFEDVINEETGEPVLNDDGTVKRAYKLKWGVDEAENKRAAFLDAAVAALSGLEPLLMALISNKEFTNPDVTDGDCRGIKVGYGQGNASVGIDLSLKIDPITLTLNFSANDGWDNALAPIFEALGLTSIPHSEDLQTTRKLLENGLLAMIDQLIAKLDANPIEFILDALPNLAYALEGGLVEPLLHQLKTVINYYADAQYDAGVASGKLLEAMKSEEPVLINIGEMINLKDMGLDISNFAAIWNMIAGGVELLANAEAPDAAYIASLGTLVEKNTNRSVKTYTAGTAGKAYHINANRADVLQYLVKWLLESGLLNGLVEEPSELIAGIFANLQNNSNDAVAAIVELLTQETIYDAKNFNWFDGTIDGVSVLGNSATEIYLNPNNDWTEAKAEYLYNNIDDLLTSILTMAGADFDLGTTISDAIGGLLSDKTLTALAGLLAGLDLNALLAGEAEETTPDASEPETVAEGEESGEDEATEAPALDVTALINDLLGIDLSVFAAESGMYKTIAAALEADENYEYDFGVDAAEDKAAAFAAALTTVLAPLDKVLNFILAGDNLEIKLGTETVKLHGADGYNNGLIPLLEALGCDVTARAGLETSELAAVINALVARINALTTGDVVKNIINLLPGVLYFITSNGLSTSVLNLLQPVVVIIDTIRPVINVMELINNIEVGEEGAKKPLKEFLGGEINLERLDVNFIFKLLPTLLPDLDLSGLKNVIYDVCKDLGSEYTSESTLAGQTTWKKGAYNDNFKAHDMLTVLLSFVLEWATVADNAAKLDELLKTDGIIASLNTVFASVEITYGTPDWMYWFEDDEEAFNAYLERNEDLPNTLASLEYPNGNEWDLDTAKYFAEHIDELVDTVIAMINEGKTDDEGKALPTDLATLLSNLVNGLVNADTLNDLVGMITGLLGDIDENLINTAGYLLDVDLAGLKAYTCEAEIDSISDFINELANVLDTYAGGLINWLFFGDDYRFAKKSDKTDTIVINGGLGYEKGLAMILEALGCELPEEANTKTVLGALATRIDYILKNDVDAEGKVTKSVVDKVLDLLPNLVYFLNANGAGVAVSNLLAPVNALLDKLATFGLNINIADLVAGLEVNGKPLNLDLAKLSLENVVTIVETATDLKLDAAEAILVNFCTGKITKGEYIYKMAAAREDVITILLVVALELISDDAFAAKLDEMLGTDFIAKIKEIFAPSDIEYDKPDWNYADADNGTVDAMKYSITYPNNWNKETAAYVTDVLLSDDFDKLIAGLIEDGKYASISELLKDKVNIFTTKTLEDLLDLIEGFLGGIDESLLELGFILDVDLNGLMKHEVKEDINDVKAFAAELSTILGTYAPGVVEWLLLGRDFKLLVKDADGIGEGLEGDPYITISGAKGYEAGLVLLLEALGCENLPALYDENGEALELDTAKTVEAVLTSLANRIDEILSDPIEEVIALLPNLFYFLNTNGVAAVIKNTTAALTALSKKINVFAPDVNLDVASMVDLKGLLKLPAEAALSMENLSMAAVLEAVGMLVGLDLTKVEDVLVGFALGEYDSEYKSESKLVGTPKKMIYTDKLDEAKMVTVVANLVLLALADEANAEFVKGLVGEDAYKAILNVLQIKEAELKKMSWQHTDKVGQSFNAMSSSENYKGYGYGPRYTEEMADYIAENIGEFVDNIIYLLGIEIEGESVDSLEEILKNLVNGNLYNSANIVAIRDALAGFLDKISGLEVKGINVGKYIVEVLKTSLGVDISAVAKVEVPEFTEDKAKFIEYLGKVVDPLGPILNWILTDEDIAFFAKEGEDDKPTDFIKLPGNAGYKNGIVLLLEALDCQNIVDPAKLEGASGSAIVTAIAEPLLNRLDEIINNPAEELLAVLPNLIYFINSNGVDVVVKNTLDAVYRILNAIEPIAKIDLYEIIGLDLEDLTFEKLIDMLLKDLEIAGFKFTEIPMDTFVELTVGKLETYDSLSAEDPAYRMVYDENSASEGDMVTVLLRLVITFILTENNREVLINLLKSELGMSADAEKYVAALFKALADCTIGNQLGMDSALATIYYVYYGVDKGVGEAADGKKDLDKAWQAKLKELGYSDNKDEQSVGNLITDILDIVFNDQGNVPDDGGNDVLDKDGLAPNGFIAFFQRIAKFFEEIGEFFRNLFSFGK